MGPIVVEQERRLSGKGGRWSSAYVLPTKADIFISSFRCAFSKERQARLLPLGGGASCVLYDHGLAGSG